MTPNEIATVVGDPARLAILRETGLLDSPPEPCFDRLTRLAARMLDAPVALLSLVDRDRQFFKSGLGLPGPWAERRETPLSHSFCMHVVATGQPLAVADARTDARVRDNGAVVDLGLVAYLGVPVTTEAGVALGSFCVIDGVPRSWRDVDLETLRDLADTLMVELTRRALERTLRSSEERLERALEAADRANRSRDEFVANISHEVRTPMAAIVGSAEMLLDPSLPAPDRDQATRAIRRNGERLLRIIDDILDFSKLEAGKMEFQPIPCSPWQVVLDVAASRPRWAGDKTIEIATESGPGVPDRVLIDPARTRRILEILVDNAVKFSAPGAKVRIRLDGGPTPGGDPDSRWIRFEVTDHGIGMSAEEVSRLFQPFQQGDASTTRKYGGTGLGLSVAHRLVEAMAGAIAVSSQPGAGSTFSVRIPVRVARGPRPSSGAAEASRATPFPSATATTRLEGRVLLADDSADNRLVLLYQLRRAGLEVEVAGDGREAVELARKGAFDVVLMDMQMPVIDGYEAAGMLRRSGFNTPIIALTAHALRGDREKCLRAGCADYLTKPVDPRHLIETLARHMDPSRRSKVASDRSKALDATEPWGHDQPDVGSPAWQGAETEPWDLVEDASPASPARLALDPRNELDLELDVDLAPLVREFERAMRDRVGLLREALFRGDRHEIETLAHQTKGASAMYGHPRLGQTAAVLERAVRNGDDADALARLVERFADVVKELMPPG